jgi:hypothetical protein
MPPDGRRAVILAIGDPPAVAATRAIQAGDVEGLRRLLAEHPGLAGARLEDRVRGSSRSLLHVATDWPGHFPRVAETIAVLVAAGADVDARHTGAHAETPLHWAASSDDLAALDALLDAGADIEADGGVIGGGTPLDDARAFLQWRTARRLVERGAVVSLGSAATLGLTDRVEACYALDPPPSAAATSAAFWHACHGGQQAVAEFLLSRGADIDWIPPWERLTPLDAARRSDARGLADWLVASGATSATRT